VYYLSRICNHIFGVFSLKKLSYFEENLTEIWFNRYKQLKSKQYGNERKTEISGETEQQGY
jgi:hypothetical protein